MKFLPKLMVAALGFAAAAPAFATIAVGNTVEFFIQVYDPNADNGVGSPSGKSYVRDLGLRGANFSVVQPPVSPDTTTRVVDGTTWGLFSTPGSSLETGSVLQAGYDLTFSADPILANLLSSASNINDVTWAVIGFDTSSASSNPLRIFTTTRAPETQVETMTNTVFGQILTTGSNALNFITGTNGLGTHPNPTGVTGTNQNGSNTATQANGAAYVPAGTANQLGNSGTPFNTMATVGQEQLFYQLSASTGQFVSAAQYAEGDNIGTWRLGSDGVLVYSVQAIPEPSTYALMAAGLIGVGALARRRKQ